MTRFLTGLAVLAVAVIAAVVSFSHVESLALAHGQPLADSRLLPLSLDGLLVVSSLVLLAEARAHRGAPGLARAGLVLGVVATVAANIAFGARFGVIGAIVSGWPAVSFVVSTETLLSWVRRAGVSPTREAEQGTVADGVPGDATVIETAGTVSPARVDTVHTVADLPVLSMVPSSAIEAAEASLRATIAAGNPLSANQLQERFSLTRAQATKVRSAVLAEANGHDLGGTDV